MAVVGGTLLLFAVSLGFLVTTPSLIGPDEPYHFDRVIAAAHGDLWPDAGDLTRSQGARGAESTFARTQMKRNSPSWAEYTPIPRDERPSLDELGGDNRTTADRTTNYLTQHPPLYYDVMGAVMWLLPDADSMPADQLVFLLRAFNVLLILLLPFLFYSAGRELKGNGPVAAGAAYLPALIPGLPRTSALINNDNLGIVIGAAIIWLCLRVLRGNSSRRTAAWLSALAVAGALTKLTVVIVAGLIVVVYAVRLVRDRRIPVPTLVILSAGAVLASAWWVKNLVKFGHLVPEREAWGSRWATTIAVPRTSENPPDLDFFWTQIGRQVPLRLWGSLGLHEPPQLPWVLLWTMSAVAVVAVVVAVRLSPGIRLEIAAPWLLTLAVIAIMVRESLNRYTTYTALTGIQGRYIYCTALGLLLPVAITTALLLRRHARWTPVVIAVAVTLVSGWALDLSFAFAWLHRFETLSPANAGRMLFTLSGHFPYAPPAPRILILIGAAAWLGAMTLAVRGARAATGTVPGSKRRHRARAAASGEDHPASLLV